MKKIAISLLALTLGVVLAVPAMAGPGSVEVTVPGDITLRMGAQVRVAPTGEVAKDFGLSDTLTKAEEKNVANSLRSLALFGDSTRGHLTECGGDVKDTFVRTEDRLFFNFAKANDWDVYMMLETDTVFSSESADTTDFIKGIGSQQFGIERLEASFNLPWMSSRLKAGWDARGIDIGYGGLVYGDDDTGIGLVGAADAWKWEAWFIKKREDEAGYGLGADANPGVGAAVQAKNEDRNAYYAKLGRQFDSTYLEGFYAFHRSNRATAKGCDNLQQHFAGLQGKGKYGILMPTFEFAYSFGDYEASPEDLDIDSLAGYFDLAFDLHDSVGIKRFEPHLGFFYLQGDDDVSDDDLEGFTSIVGITRFTPRFGSDVAAIAYDGNPLLGQVLYSFFPNLYGSQRFKGGNIVGAGQFDNPGFQMYGGGLKAAWGKWSYNTNVMYMLFDEEEPVEAFYAILDPANLANVKIDDEMGIEWNNELKYKLYDEVTIKGAASFLFPGDGAEDITQALNAYGRDVPFDQGKSSDDVQMLFRLELVWFF
jgi:hypothetical protein